MTHAVVVVESPAKAKTINKYLGKDFTVLASYGHVRDLPSKDGSVRPDEDFAMDYEVDAESRKPLSAISSALKNADALYLATDPDREGEAISWHVLEALKSSKKIPKEVTTIKRIVFTEITKKAVTEAIANPRDIDMDLVNAQQARRALDYLVGFNLSPILWRKLPGSRSAGRVQSVALRLICEREAEIETFEPQEYWTLAATLATATNEVFTARLIEFDGARIEKFSLTNEADARRVESAIVASQFTVASVTPKTLRRAPYAPFSTATLQMEASRKLGFTAKRTMQVAQKLYEDGFITYMRTDGVVVSQEAIQAARALIAQDYGDRYLPANPRQYKTKTKNAQEAHEAIRPTDLSRTPAKAGLDGEQAELYALIWKRMVASQMELAVYDQVSVDMRDASQRHALRATGSVLKFDGFLKLYQEAIEDDQKTGDDADEETSSSQRLPALTVGDVLASREIKAEQHFTQPPPRYSEASLVKRLEELGIGRPSTYASIISTLIDRGYVKLDKRRFTAESLGRVVTAFLMSYFDRYVEYGFTASLEEALDAIADGERDWKTELEHFWKDFSARVEESKTLTITDVLTKVDALLEPFIFGRGDHAVKARICPSCNQGRLGLKTGKFGSFLGCSNYPDCNYTRPLAAIDADAPADANAEEYPKLLGTDPVSNEAVSLRKGPYGVYVQLGDGKKPKRTGLPRNVPPAAVDFDKALALLALPREVGLHPETGEKIVANIGRFGPYLLHAGKYVTLKGEDDVLTVGMNRAVSLIAEAANRQGGKGRAAAEPLKELGAHPDTGEKIILLKGRYGPYIKFAGKNITAPKVDDPTTLTLDDVLPLLAAKGGKKSAKKKAAPPAAKKTTAKKPAAAKSKAAKK